MDEKRTGRASKGESEVSSFWTTLPGILTGLAALVTAIGGLLVIFRPPASTQTLPTLIVQPTSAALSPSKVTPMAARVALDPTFIPTSTPTPNVISNSTSSSVLEPTSIISVPNSSVDVSGVWIGMLTYILGDNVENYNYRLELMQDGEVIQGKSRIERIEDPGDFAEYTIGGLVVTDQERISIRLKENNLTTYHNYNNFSTGDPVVAKVMHFNYAETQGKVEIQGDWNTYVGNGSSDGKIHLTKQQ